MQVPSSSSSSSFTQRPAKGMSLTVKSGEVEEKGSSRKRRTASRQTLSLSLSSLLPSLSHRIIHPLPIGLHSGWVFDEDGLDPPPRLRMKQ